MGVDLLIMGIVALIASMADAFCDTLNFHGGNTRFWISWFVANNPSDTYKNKYNNWMANSGWFGRLLATTIFVSLWDWWHRFKTIAIIALPAWVIVFNLVTKGVLYWHESVILFIIYIVVYLLNFTLWFNYILYKKQTA